MTEIIDMLIKLSKDMETMTAYIKNLNKKTLESLQEEWVDGQVVMQTLHISTRTLQSLRDSGVLPYSRINRKFYYKTSDIEALLKSNYSHSKSKYHENN